MNNFTVMEQVYYPYLTCITGMKELREKGQHMQWNLYKYGVFWMAVKEYSA